MKTIAFIATLVIGWNISSNAQTNRTYYSDMQTQQMYENERNSSSVNTKDVQVAPGLREKNYLNVNSVDVYEGYKTNSDDISQQRIKELKQNNREWNEITRDDIPYTSIPYDTSKNNGHCIGCGSGTMTDYHPWK